jgi:hypothetical protein
MSTGKKTSTNIKLGVDIIVCGVLDNLAAEIGKLSLSDNDNAKLLVLIEQMKEEKHLNTDKKVRVSNKKSSDNTTKRVIKEENRCTGTSKEGKSCGGPMCDKDLKICWAHMTKDQKESYKLKKDKGKTPVTTSKKYTVTTA